MKKAWLGRALRDGAAEAPDSEDPDSPQDGERGNMGDPGSNPSPRETVSPGPSTASEQMLQHEPMEENSDDDVEEVSQRARTPPHGYQEAAALWSARYRTFVNVTPVQASVIQVVHAAYDSMLFPSSRHVAGLFFDENLTTEEFIWLCMTVRHRCRSVREEPWPIANQRRWRMVSPQRTWPMGFCTRHLMIENFELWGTSTVRVYLTATLGCEGGERHRVTYSAGTVMPPRMSEFFQKQLTSFSFADYTRSHSSPRYHMFFDLVSSGRRLYPIWISPWSRDERIAFVQFVGWLCKPEHRLIHYWFTQCTGRRRPTRPWLKPHPPDVPYENPLTSRDIAIAFACGLAMELYAVRLPNDPIIVEDGSDESDSESECDPDSAAEALASMPCIIPDPVYIHGRPKVFATSAALKQRRRFRAVLSDPSVVDALREQCKKQKAGQAEQIAAPTPPKTTQPTPHPQVPTVILHRPHAQPLESQTVPPRAPYPLVPQPPLPHIQVAPVIVHQPPAQVSAPESLLDLLEQDNEDAEQRVMSTFIERSPLPRPMATRAAPCVYREELDIEEDEPAGLGQIQIQAHLATICPGYTGRSNLKPHGSTHSEPPSTPRAHIPANSDPRRATFDVLGFRSPDWPPKNWTNANPSTANANASRPISAAPGRARPPAAAPGRARPPAAAPGRARPPAAATGRARPPAAAPGRARPPAAAPGRARPPAAAPGRARPPAAAPGRARPPAAAPGRAAPQQQPQAGPAPQQQPQAGPAPQQQPQAGPASVIVMPPQAPKRGRPASRKPSRGAKLRPLVPTPDPQGGHTVQAPVFFPPASTPSSQLPRKLGFVRPAGASTAPQAPTQEPGERRHWEEILPPKRAKTDATVESQPAQGEQLPSFSVIWENLSLGLEPALGQGEFTTEDGANEGTKGGAAESSPRLEISDEEF
ncbi:EBNA-3B [Macacine gammaherpesvirus 4]|uniref:EBNA-3B n=1 Tax=Macacine gammaherpesvirus 4 TaxID=45455 RepID=Q9IMX9_9GAMA|nr:EBNA-3B [Macacine gammaherpesvirus 4]AAF78882.2 EBNA-3B [Macacine gammaherpesvirus 4]